MSEPYDISQHPMKREPWMLDRSDPAFAGQAVYTPKSLRAYDAIVVKLSNSLAWRCPASAILAQYERHLSASHLDVGPGTGYYLDHSRFPDQPDVTLLDPNSDVLRFASERLQRYRPTTHAADALKPIKLEPASFCSAALSYVLHCLPGDIAAKSVVFDNLVPLMKPGGVVFGTTILGRGVSHTRLGRTLLRIYNRKGIFSNTGDDLDQLEHELGRRFERYELDVTGAVALFAGWTT